MSEAREIIHDLNNLFAALSGFTELLLDDLPAETLPGILARRIMQGQSRAEELVAQLTAILPR